jgi:cytochrome b561
MTPNQIADRYHVPSIALHWVLLALFHHYIKRDNTMLRMRLSA